MVKTFHIDGQDKHAMDSLNFSISGTPFLITESSIPDNGEAFHVVKNLASGKKKVVLHSRLLKILLLEKSRKQ